MGKTLIASVALGAFLVAGLGLGAMDIKTVDGKVYSNVVVWSIAADGIGVKTKKDGVVFLPFKNLPPAVQQQYGYNPTLSAEYQGLGQTLTIKTVDGKVYKGNVIDCTPVQIDIQTTTPGGVTDIVGIKYDKMDDATLKRFGYTRAQAVAADKKAQAVMKRVAAAQAKEAARDARREALLNQIDEEASTALEGKGVALILHVDAADPCGLIGYARTNLGEGNGDDMGRICLMGVRLQPGAAWYGTAYPVGSNVNAPVYGSVPCYAPFNVAKGIIEDKMIGE